MHSKLPLQINISPISKSNFEDYNKNIIMPNKHRINYLRLSNPFTVDTVFSPPRIISKFLGLETLIFDNIDTKYLNNIFNQLIHLPKLHSLVLNLVDCIQGSNKLFFNILRLPKLKYLKLTYQTKTLKSTPVSFDKCHTSPIEHLIMNCRFQIDSFSNLLCCLPKLRRLSIDCLIETNNTNIALNPILLKDLKYVTLNLGTVCFNGFEKLVKDFFQSIEVLHVTTRSDPLYLDAQRWEELILSSMSNLRVFDFNHNECQYMNNPKIYHDLVNQFTSRFWIERKWFFTHQHDWRGTLDSGLFYSTNPYR